MSMEDVAVNAHFRSYMTSAWLELFLHSVYQALENMRHVQVILKGLLLRRQFGMYILSFSSVVDSPNFNQKGQCSTGHFYPNTEIGQ